MRKYQMIHPVGREMVDLCTFEAEIKNAVAEIMPFAKVEVAANYYTVEPSPYHSQAIKIGQILGKIATLRQYSIQITRTFCSGGGRGRATNNRRFDSNHRIQTDSDAERRWWSWEKKENTLI